MDLSRFSLARVAGIVLMLLAWGIASNRCAFASLALNASTAAAEIHQCCPGSGGDEDHPMPQRSGECCQALSALLGEGGADLVKAPVPVLLFELAWSLLAVRADQTPEEAAPTIGPPESLSFAEVVLQRSVLSHAPPFVA